MNIILLIAIAGALGALGYFIINPTGREVFTEFYILNIQRRADNYPSEVRIGKEVVVIVGIVNNERKMVTYHVEIDIDGVKNFEIGSLQLNNGERWEETISLKPSKAGDNQKVEFLLFKNGETEPCLEPPCLWINVID